MKIMDGLKALEHKLEQELREFFLILGESETPESWPEQERRCPLRPQAQATPSKPLH